MSPSKSARPQQQRLTRLAGTFAAAITVLLMASGVADARLGTPGLQSPRNKAVVRSLPAFTWRAVRRAATYEFEFSETRNFSSSVTGFGNNPLSLSDTAITNNQTIPNGTYYWRVRAVSAKNVPGRWSRMRKLVKRWKAAPKLESPVNATVNWPTSPLLLKWSPVAGAVNYQLKIGTSPQLSNLVSGPTDVQGPQYAFPSTLPPGTYYWAVQPIDAAGNLGTSSAVKQFTWAWPSDTTLAESDVSPDPTYEEPSFSWTAVPGASSYEVQVATLPTYPANAVILDSTGLLATTYTATKFFPDHTTLYWRVRAIDARGDAGDWNSGQPFTESFDQQTPSIQNLQLYDQNGNVLPIGNMQPNTDPILRWSPVPGASDYRITLAVWNPTQGCLFNGGGSNTATTTTPSTSWSPAADPSKAVNGDAWQSTLYGWPSKADSSSNRIYFGSGADVCVSLIAERHDSPLAGSTIASAPTLLGNNATPAFYYGPPAAASGTVGPVTSATYTPGIVEPNAGSGAVGANGTVPTTPMFEWQPVANADGYYIVVANAENFSPNSIVTGGFVQDTTWTPTGELNDQSAAYWWEVIPVAKDQYAGAPALNPQDPSAYAPQAFNKSSVPPTPVSPLNGANVPTQPTFSWQSAQAAANYTLEISADSTFANPIQSVTTDNTSYATTSTLPAGKTLYWRVRTNDISNNLNWSAIETFTHNLPAPSPPSAPKSGFTIPLLSWGPVTGAISYNLQITNGGHTSTVSVATPYMTPTEFLSPGTNHLQVQSVFPGGLSSAFSGPTTYNRTIPSPGGIHASKHGTRILVRWRSDPLAKAYEIQLSTTTGFGSPIAGATTQNTAWVPQLSATDARLRLYWRLAAVDYNGNVGAWHSGVFNGRHAKKKKKTEKH